MRISAELLQVSERLPRERQLLIDLEPERAGRARCALLEEWDRLAIGHDRLIEVRCGRREVLCEQQTEVVIGLRSLWIELDRSPIQRLCVIALRLTTKRDTHHRELIVR